MSKLIGVFILGILVGWLVEWIFVRLFVPNPKKKLETALQISRKENDTLQKQNRELQAELSTAKEKLVASPAQTLTNAAELIVVPTSRATPVTSTPVVETTVADDLTKLNGIGPKLAEAMQANGIKRYAQLAELTINDLNEKLASSNIRYSKASAESWAKQATLAAAGDWDGLKTYQNALKA
ncbi:Predicted 5' DNA nuclease, flap endonuclease-1-like, helix-3-turn-helix (H3TH) domain [Thiothrix caldifontis]|uniref:Predicted 5' DNA nuclease, flap endonuclease-1-like, helix-3-turn-helix (H3TH) domain n=1 Tax=Thiothrix caldifontis TaxID=525918 RepID=A0A1H4A4M2_9GAMM|nr:helix-hairpin-helix domain-containing protein [Thiothrix caldifontis]SEA30820.1 Predicted 5' DNA nuclease, flap endonuclease-1-like, helix-3-turn-helix (H3TH) domain [Thiothrix caldifontis]